MRPLEYLKKWFVNFGMIKLVMILLVMYLIYEELLLYWKIKPTQTSVSELKIADVQNPNIFICKSPEYDNTMFRYFKSLLWTQVPSFNHKFYQSAWLHRCILVFPRQEYQEKVCWMVWKHKLGARRSSGRYSRAQIQWLHALCHAEIEG